MADSDKADSDKNVYSGLGNAQENCKGAISDNVVGTVILSAAKNLVEAQGLASRPGDSSLRSE